MTHTAAQMTSKFWGLGAGLACLAVTLMPSAAHAENLIRHPGAHNEYKFELEPHLNFYWGQNSYYLDTMVGPGIRASIPLMHNGPIDTINNNIAISFGLDTVFPGGGFGMLIPVAFQWNFYFTDVISVLGEVGLNGVATFHDRSGIYTNGGGFTVDPLFQGGGRFQWGRYGVLVRVGYPSASVGFNMQF